ncbi:TrkA C-terminal domain-containing protein [Streptomyces sp. AVP053U2]|uniref:TrkA C-terminal domain-containing protein n=1 Tax=Streptomyces sp. AVP053U2 TaxID=1737066 RepID=UPI0035201E91
MGQRVAHLVRGRMLDYIEFEDDFAMVKTKPPTDIIGLPLSNSAVRTRHGATVVAIKRPGEGFTYATPETVVEVDDTIIVAGRTRATERFSELQQDRPPADSGTQIPGARTSTPHVAAGGASRWNRCPPGWARTATGRPGCRCTWPPTARRRPSTGGCSCR